MQLKKLSFPIMMFFIAASVGLGQELGPARRITFGGTLPSVCNPAGEVFIRTGATNPGLYRCTAANTWTGMVPFSGAWTDLDMGNNRILNIGAPGTDFTATGGLSISSGIGVGFTPPAAGIQVADQITAGASGYKTGEKIGTFGTGGTGSLWDIFVHNYGGGNVNDTAGIGFTAGAFQMPADHATARVKSAIVHQRIGGWGMGDLIFLVDSVADDADVALTDWKYRMTYLGHFLWAPLAFASLGAPANGSFAYCSDCTIANPCAGGGNGALAKRLNGIWVCN